MNLKEAYQKQGYVVLRKVIDPQEAAKMYQYTLSIIDRGNLDDGQVPGSPSFYQDPEVIHLQERLKPQLEQSIDKRLLPVFCYHRVYRKDAILRSHKDSIRAEISASINLGQQGEPWDLWLLDYNENATAITLEPGDALLYNGLNLCHWRGKLVNADYVSQIMFHFVDKDGKNKSAARSETIRKFRQNLRKLFGVKY